MNSIASEQNKVVQTFPYVNSQEELISKLYGLKERFQLMYYGKAECKKYDKARAFTIALNAALYKVNKLGYDVAPSESSYRTTGNKNSELGLIGYPARSEDMVKQIQSNIGKLEKDLNDLIG